MDGIFKLISLRTLALRSRMGTLWWHTLLMFVANRIGDLANLFIGLYLVPLLMPDQDLGALLPLIAIGGMFSLPVALLLIPVGKFLNVYAAIKEHGKVKALLQDALVLSLLFAFVVVFWLFRQGDGVLIRLHVEDRRLFWPMAGFAMMSCIGPVINAALRALQRFKTLVVISLLSPYIRLAGMFFLLAPLGALGYLTAQLGIEVFAAIFGFLAIFFYLRGMGRRTSYWSDWREMLSYTWPLIAMSFATRIQAPIEMLVIRHRLPTVDSAGYYYAQMFGNVPVFLTSAMMPFLWSLMSDRFEKGQETQSLLKQSVLFTAFVGLLSVSAFACLMPFVFKLPGPWQPYAGYANFVWQTGLIGTMKTVQTIYTSHEMACRRFRYMRYLVPMMLLESAVLYILPAWSLFKGYVPDYLWNIVNLHATPTLQLFVNIILIANLLFTLSMLLEWIQANRKNRS